MQEERIETQVLQCEWGCYAATAVATAVPGGTGEFWGARQGEHSIAWEGNGF